MNDPVAGQDIVAAYSEALNAVYASFLRRKHDITGRHDRQTRHPQVVHRIAADLGLLPRAETTIRVTGSKGKGSVARMLAQLLEQDGAGPVGLFVSPEERAHTDRMRLAGVCPEQSDFVRLYRELQPHLSRAEQSLPPGAYLSPFGTFLLMALKFFAERGAKTIVLETGRGAEFDEVGQIASKVAVLTAILIEHSGYIGPGLADIARNKLFIGRHSDWLVCPAAVAQNNARLGLVAPQKILTPPAGGADAGDLPAWLAEDALLARMGASALLGREVSAQADLRSAAASFGQMKTPFGRLYYEASVQSASLDMDYLARLARAAPDITFVASLPDDKDRAAIRAAIAGRLGAPFLEVSLRGDRGVLAYRGARSGAHAFETTFDDPQAFRRRLCALADARGTGVIYCLGTQTFVRLVRAAFGA